VLERIGQTLRAQGRTAGRTKRHAHRGDYRFTVGQDAPKRGRRGYDAGKKIKGRKRHIAVDTQGNLLAVIVHSAGIQDRVAARAVLMRLFCRFDSITTVFADGGYIGRLIDWAKDMFGYSVEIAKRNEQHLFSSAAQALDRRTHLCMAQLVTPSQQGLRTSSCLGRIHDPYRIRTHAPATIPLVSGQALRADRPYLRILG
jgi:hypothetical protein